MELFNRFMILTQQSDAERPSLFPFPFSMHLIFVCISVVFFIYRFTAQKRPYQLLMAVAVLVSMCVWISDNRTLYYAIGAIELILIVASVVLSIIIKRPAEDKKSDDGKDDKNDNDGSDDSGNSDEDEDAMTVLNAANTVNNLLNN